MYPHGLKSILIIDDSLDIQFLLRLLLETKGYVIQCTSNGEEALGFLSSSIDLPDVILLDLQMPVMDGWEFLEIKRNDERLKNIPTVVMSGDETQFEIQEPAHILKKPLDLSSILQVLN